MSANHARIRWNGYGHSLGVALGRLSFESSYHTEHMRMAWSLQNAFFDV